MFRVMCFWGSGIYLLFWAIHNEDWAVCLSCYPVLYSSYCCSVMKRPSTPFFGVDVRTILRRCPEPYTSCMQFLLFSALPSLFMHYLNSQHLPIIYPLKTKTMNGTPRSHHKQCSPKFFFSMCHLSFRNQMGLDQIGFQPS